MARALSLVLSVLLVSSSTLVSAGIGKGIRRLLHRDVLQDFEDCTGSEWETDLLTRFTGIFFGDFYTGGDKDILGALAVEGNLHAPNYAINVDHGADCAAVNSFNSYGLVVGGFVDTFNTNVHGSAYIAGGGTIEEILELDNGCLVTDQSGTGLFDFALVKDLLQSSSQDFATHPPTAILESNGDLTELRDNQLTHYEILTFHTCSSTSCSMDSDSESNPNHIFFNQGSWNGVHSFDVDPKKTYILNIPVTNGATFTLTTPHPSQGFYPCSIIYNLYPVDGNGNYMADGEFTFHRKNSDKLLGFVLAPRGHIVDGNTGNFAGTVVGLDYTWQNLHSGVEILDYRAGGADCDYHEGCIPNHATTTPTAIFPTATSSTSSRTRTRTWSLTIPNLFTRTRTRTLTYETISIPTIDIIDWLETRTATKTSTMTSTVTSVISDSSTTFTTAFTETQVTTEIVKTTVTETVETFTETSCPVDFAQSTVTETIGERTNLFLVAEPAHTTTVTVTTDIFTATETDSTLAVTDYATTTKRKLYIKPVTRTRTECIGDIGGTATATEGGSETCNDDHHHGHHHDHHHGHHHGPGEKCEEGEDDQEDKKHYHKEGKQNYDEDEDEYDEY
ncbi:hypothetical protein PS15m_005866 [Mucor circinelloides]